MTAPVWFPTMPRRVRLLEGAADLLALTRLHAASWLTLLVIAGWVVEPGHLTWHRVVELGSFAALTSSLGFTVNNIADRDRDALDPSRASAPLVSGRVSTHAALVLACGCQLAALAVLLISALPAEAVGIGLICLALITAGNAYQKSVGRFAPLMDFIFGFGMGLMVVFGGVAGDQPLTRRVVLVALAVAAQMTLLNVTAGNLKDLDVDAASPGTTTTALVLGVRPGAAAGRPIYSRRYATFVVTSHLGWVAAGLSLILTTSSEVSSTSRFGTSALAGALVITASIDLARLLLRRRNPGRRGRELFLFTNFAALLLVAAPERLLIVLGLLPAALIWEASVQAVTRTLRVSAFAGTTPPEHSNDDCHKNG